MEKLFTGKKNVLFYSLIGLFVAVNTLLIWQEFFWLPLLPLLVGTALLAILSLDRFVILIAFLTPISVTLEEVDLGAALSLPSEPMIIMAMMLFIAKCLLEGTYDTRIFRHPVSIVLLLSLVWMVYTSALSEIPSVSFKFLASRLWFVTTFYFLAIEIFRRKENIHRFLWAHALGLLVVIVYTTYSHWTWGFEKDPAHWVMTPFYHDHTAYGMILALSLPFITGYVFHNRFNLFMKILIAMIWVAFIVALRLSNSRAAWVSVVACIGVYFLYYFRIRWYVFGLLSGIALLLFLGVREQVVQKLEKNRQDSSEDFTEHVQSISNISSDASNLERINRWECAISMWEERPVLGFGPGTYKFVYARFQKPENLTIISTNAGNRGTAHSEYLGPLSEQGLPGLILVLAGIATLLWTGARVYYHADPVYSKTGMWILLGLITYWIHGVLNNFLELDKAAVPYWGMAAILVSLDLYGHRDKLS